MTAHTDRSRIRPGWRAVPWAFATAVFVLRALQLRGRAESFRVLPPAPTDHQDGVEALGQSDYELVTVDGARVEPATLDAAVAFARREGLSVLELVPSGVDAERSLDLLRAVTEDEQAAPA